jgi:hypothetical protein
MLAIRILAGLFNPSAAANASMTKVHVAQSIACPDPIRFGSAGIFLQGAAEAQRPKAYGVCSSQRHQSAARSAGVPFLCFIIFKKLLFVCFIKFSTQN